MAKTSKHNRGRKPLYKEHGAVEAIALKRGLSPEGGDVLDCAAVPKTEKVRVNRLLPLLTDGAKEFRRSVANGTRRKPQDANIGRTERADWSVSSDTEKWVDRWQGIVTRQRANDLCKRKYAHDTEAAADVEAARITPRKDTFALGQMHSFKCRICGKWHVANITARDVVRMFPWKKIGRVHYICMLFRMTGGDWESIHELDPQDFMEFLEGLDMNKLTRAILSGQRNYIATAEKRRETQRANRNAGLGKKAAAAIPV